MASAARQAGPSPSAASHFVLATPITVQYLTQFALHKEQLPTLVLADGSVYCGDLKGDAPVPHGVGIMLFRSNPALYQAQVTRRCRAIAALDTGLFASGDRYGGNWVQGRFDGDGVLITSTYTYQGSWSEGKPHGKGCMTYSKHYVDRMPSSGGFFDGAVSALLLRGLSYLSPFDDGAQRPREYMGDYHKVHLRHGTGIMKYYNDDVYEGDWVSNRRHGQGKLLTAKGEVYMGQWVADERHGYGRIIYTNGTLFKGMMDHNRRHGEGVMSFANGDEYFGMFQNDLIEGHGVMKYKNGDIYEGEWKDGTRHGTGKYTLKRNAVTVRGDFVHGLIHGTGTVEHPGVSTFVGVFDRGERRHGTIFWHDGPTSQGRRCYQGAWAGETMHGKGLMWYTNGDFYAGGFVRNERAGPGNAREADGTEYSGEYAHDQRHGCGLLQSCDGAIKVGRWHRDRFVEGYAGEWDGTSLNGMGHVRLTLRTLMTGDGVVAAEDVAGPMVDFFGVFAEGRRNGVGVLRLPVLGDSRVTSCHVMKGSWCDDVLHCEHAVWRFASGEVYVGAVVHGRREDERGRLWLPDGSVYVGPWSQNVACGTGTFFAKNPHDPIYRRLATPPSGVGEVDTTTVALPTTSTPKTRSTLDVLWRVFTSGPDSICTSADVTSSPHAEARRVWVGYRDHYLMTTTWRPLELTRAQYTARSEKAPPLLETADVGLDKGSAVGETAAPPFARPDAPETTPVVHPDTAVALKPPDTLLVGAATGDGVVVYGSGVRVQMTWRGNYPELVTPYRPGSFYDAYVRWVNDVEAQVQLGVGTVRHEPTPWPSAQSVYAAALAECAGREGWGPAVSRKTTDNAEHDDTNGGVVETTTTATLCSFCTRPYTFYRRATQCTVCLRASCSACLGALEVDARPEVTVLLRRSQALLRRVQGNESDTVDDDVALLRPSGGQSVGVCGDCIRAVLQELRLVTLCVPIALFCSVLPPCTEDGLEAAAGPHPVSDPDLVVNARERCRAPSAEYVTPAETEESAAVGVCTTRRAIAPDSGADAPATPDFSRASRSSTPVTVVPTTELLPPPRVLTGDVVYFGYTAHNVPHLWGRMWWGSRYYYEGGFEHGARHGYGTQYMRNGERYVGGFRHDAWEGPGMYFAETGAVLHGRFHRGRLDTIYYHGEVDAKGRRHGRGIGYDADGSTYNGEWVRGRRHGTGLRQGSDGAVYAGEFAADQAEGKGKLVTRDGAYYGSFVAGQKHGTGCEFVADGAVQATWERGLRHGFCRVFYAATGDVYETTYSFGNERDDCFAPPIMADDADCVRCARCKTSFGLFLRRHHCRLCGEVFCDACTQHRATLPAHFAPDATAVPRRICDACFQRLEQRRMLGLRRYANGAVYAGCWSRGRWVSCGLYCRTDGVCVVMDAHGKPLLPAHSTTDELDVSDAAVSGTSLIDLSPTRAVLDALPSGSSMRDVDAFVMWWGSTSTRCRCRVLLEVPLLQRYYAAQSHPHRVPDEHEEWDVAHSHYDYPAIPDTPAPRLFVTSRGGDVEAAEAAALRAARFVPALIPPIPVCALDAVAHDAVPPRLEDYDMTDEAVLRDVQAERQSRFTDEKVESDTVTRSLVCSARHRPSLLPPTPDVPPQGCDDRVGWDTWTVRPAPRICGYGFGATSSTTAETGSESGVGERVLYHTVPLWRPSVPPVEEVIERGKLQCAARLQRQCAMEEPSVGSPLSETARVTPTPVAERDHDRDVVTSGERWLPAPMHGPFSFTVTVAERGVGSETDRACAAGDGRARFIVQQLQTED